MRKLFEEVTENTEEEVYDPSVYATASAYEGLMREGQVGQALEMGEVYGDDIGDIDQMDPMEILMLLEERGAR